jgi:hypothetical protein
MDVTIYNPELDHRGVGARRIVQYLVGTLSDAFSRRQLGAAGIG